jgi:hypothetical protein
VPWGRYKCNWDLIYNVGNIHTKYINGIVVALFYKMVNFIIGVTGK